MFNFGIYPPWYRNSIIEQTAFNLYIMEKEGCFSKEEDSDDNKEKEIKDVLLDR